AGCASPRRGQPSRSTPRSDSGDRPPRADRAGDAPAACRWSTRGATWLRGSAWPSHDPDAGALVEVRPDALLHLVEDRAKLLAARDLAAAQVEVHLRHRRLGP